MKCVSFGVCNARIDGSIDISIEDTDTDTDTDTYVAATRR